SAPARSIGYRGRRRTEQTGSTASAAQFKSTKTCARSTGPRFADSQDTSTSASPIAERQAIETAQLGRPASNAKQGRATTETRRRGDAAACRWCAMAGDPRAQLLDPLLPP